MLVKTGSPELKHVSFKTFLTTFSPKLSLLFPIPSKKAIRLRSLNRKSFHARNISKQKTNTANTSQKVERTLEMGRSAKHIQFGPFPTFLPLPVVVFGRRILPARRQTFPFTEAKDFIFFSPASEN